MSDLVGNPEDLFSHNEAHMKIGLAHPYHLEEFTLMFMASGAIFHFYFILMKFLLEKNIGPDEMLRSAASHLGL